MTDVFLRNGFEVKVSATDISKKEKYAHLMTLDQSDKLHIAELNVTNKEALREFVKDCDIVIHGGTPFQLDVQDPETELFEPTIKGTEIFLDVVSETPSVEKVVLIASVAAFNTNFPMPAEGKSQDDAFDESDEAFISEESHPYAQAKFLANQVVEEFIRRNPDLNVEITSVSPVFVMGNSMSGREDSTSTGMQFCIRNKIAPNPFMEMLFEHDVLFAAVDVADVAQAIFKAATTMGLHGKNYLLSSESFSISDLARVLNGDKVQKPGKVIYGNSLARRDLDMTFKPIPEIAVA